MQEKAEQWTESAKQTAQSACDKTADVALSARDKTANLTQSTQSKSADASHSTRESAQHGQEQTAGFLGQVKCIVTLLYLFIQLLNQKYNLITKLIFQFNWRADR